MAGSVDVEQIHDYKLLAPLQNQNAGYSRWTFAERKGKKYFLKEFITPKYPDEDSLSPALRERRIAECEEYEKSQKELFEAINRASDGNLGRVFEFFRQDSHYYLTMPLIENHGLSLEDVTAMPLSDRLLLCLTAANSVLRLHQSGIVHSDIKDTNVLLERSATGKIIARIIDVDGCFFERRPPQNEDELGGDQVYLAPESCMFFCGEDVAITHKIDVFALGVLFHQYLTGQLPEYNHEEYDYLHEAVLDDQLPVLSEELPEVLKNLLLGMLRKDIADRYDLVDVCDIISKELFPEYGKMAAAEPSEAEPDTRSMPHGEEAPANPSPNPRIKSTFFHTPGDL